METTKPSAAGIAFKWAIISLFTSIIIQVLYQVAGVDQFGPIKWLGFIPLIAFVFLAQNDFRKLNQGFMSYGEGIIEGLLFGVFAGLLGAVFVYIYWSYINPGMVDLLVANQHNTLVARGTPDSAIEQADQITRKFGVLFSVLGSIFGTPIISVLVSLITAAILKKERTWRDIENQPPTDPAV